MKLEYLFQEAKEALLRAKEHNDSKIQADEDQRRYDEQIADGFYQFDVSVRQSAMEFALEFAQNTSQSQLYRTEQLIQFARQIEAFLNGDDQTEDTE